MITIVKQCRTAVGPTDFVGLSTDTKPGNGGGGYPIINGSTFLEMDTGDLYWFDEESGTWVK